MPGFNDGPVLERSINELAELWPAVQSISVVPVGLTQHHKYNMRPHTPAEAAATLAYVESLQPAFQDRSGLRFVYPTDEWYLVSGREVPPLEAYDGQSLHENGLGMVRTFLDEWSSLEAEISDWMVDHTLPAGDPPAVTLVTGTLFAATLREAAADFSRLVGLPLT